MQVEGFNRILAISDIHGCYEEFLLLLEKVNYDPSSDKLILLGDYVDRGKKTKDLINELIDLKESGAACLKGNHDQFFVDWILKDTPDSEYFFLQNGGIETVKSYMGDDYFADGITFEKRYQAKKYITEKYPHHINFLRGLEYYHELGSYVFVHAGIDPSLLNWKDTPTDEMIWIREWFLNADHKHKQTFIHGHTPCRYITDKDDIYFGNNKIGIDGACAYGGQLNCLVIEHEFFRCESVKQIKHN